MPRKPLTDGEREQNERIQENMTDVDWENLSLDEFEEMFEDRDPMEFL
jgi:hypothetical protein